MQRGREAGEARTIFLDTRDRMLPPDKSLLLSIAGAGEDLDAARLDGMQVRLKFKPRKEAMSSTSPIVWRRRETTWRSSWRSARRHDVWVATRGSKPSSSICCASIQKIAMAARCGRN